MCEKYSKFKLPVMIRIISIAENVKLSAGRELNLQH